MSLGRQFKLLLGFAFALGLHMEMRAQVGYVNVTVTTGFNLLVNPLNATSNHLTEVIAPIAPDGTALYRFDAVAQSNKWVATCYSNSGWYWLPGTPLEDLTLALGQGFWIEAPSAFTITFVGAVPHGSMTNPLPAFYSLKGSMVPQAGALDTSLGFPSRPFDQVWKWSNSSFAPFLFDELAFAWVPSDPIINVGQAFVLWREPSEATQANWWVRNFSIPAAPLQAAGADIRAITVQMGMVSLDISNPQNARYNVQFSRDRVNWETVARNQKAELWQQPAPPGPAGFYQLVNP